MGQMFEDYEDVAGEVFEINFVSTEDYLEELFWSNPKDVRFNGSVGIKEINWNPAYDGPMGIFEDLYSEIEEYESTN